MSKVFSSSTRRHFCQQMATAAAATFSISGTFPTTHAAHHKQTTSHASGNGINVLLVHGAYVDASSWLGVIGLLQAQGYNTLAVQLPLSSLEDDIAVTRQALATLSGPTILVGHSYGGSVISTMSAENIRGLVFADAFALEQGESVVDLASRFPTPPINAFVVPSSIPGFVWVEPSAFPANFIQDVPLAQAQALAVVQKPINPKAFATPSGTPSWKNIPSWFIFGKNDRAISPDALRFMAQRSNATTREIESSHASPVSHPHDVFDSIVAAAQNIFVTVGRG